MKVIAISGWKRSGKDASAQYLIDNKGFKRVAFADPLKDRVAEEYKVPRAHCDDPQFKEAAIEKYPVIPKDAYTLSVAKMMYKEFRTLSGKMPMDYHVDASGAFLGVMGRHVEQLYWTPRALCILKGSINRSVDSSYWVGAAIDMVKGNIQYHACADLELTKQREAKLNNFVISDLRYRSEVEQLRSAFGKDLITVRINRFDDCASNDPSERDLDTAKFDVVIENKGSLEELYSKIEELVK